MDTTTGLTRQQVTAMLKSAGFPASTEGRNGRIGYATRSFGFSVSDNGERVYTCRSCGGRSNHRDRCTTRSGAAKYWRTRLVKDGTVTLTVHGQTSSLRSDYDAVVNLARRIVLHLEVHGYTVTPVENGIGHAYRVSA